MSRHRNLAAALLGLAGLLPAGSAGAAPRIDHVVVIIVDGLRPDAIEAAHARQIQALAAHGARTDGARVEMPMTLPSLVSLVSGLTPARHGVTRNDDRVAEPRVPTIFTRASEEGLRTGLYFGKPKLDILAPRGSADVSFGPGRHGVHRERQSLSVVAGQFAADFARERYGLALVHLREPDQAGHAHGWMSAPYLAAVRAADAAVGTVLQAIEYSGLAERTAVLLTSDHGGEGTSHDARRTELSWRVPLICRVPGAKAGRRIGGEVRLLDVAPTVLALLDVPGLPDAQGRVIEECLPR